MKRREKENNFRQKSGVDMVNRDWGKPSSFRDKKTFRKISSVGRGLQR